MMMMTISKSRPWLITLVALYYVATTLAFVPISKHNPNRYLISKHKNKSLHVPHVYCGNAGTSLNAFAVASVVESFYRNSPYLAAFLICGFKVSESESIYVSRSLPRFS